MKQAMFYRQLKNNAVQCQLCPHFCTIQNSQRGKCGVRENQDGNLFSLVHSKAVANSIDPIEKKPLFHFLPGTWAYSIATVGCNLSCQFCQNWDISQGPKPQNPIVGEQLTPEQIVEQADASGCQSIAYTYTEPTIFFEYAYDTARLAKQRGIRNVFVSNGFINPEPVKEISKYLDAINIDLKGFTEDYYRNVCGGRLKPVLDAVKQYYQEGVFLELTTLIVPGHNDNDEMLRKIAEFIKAIDPRIPWHISRFFPQYKMQNVPPTDVETIHRAIRVGKETGLRHIYAGNVMADDYESTYCPNCGRKIIDRTGFSVGDIHLKKDRCEFCNHQINLVNP